jgi:TolA-binding protein
MEQFRQASALMERLLEGEYGRLDARQDDYPRYLQALCLYWEGDRYGAYEKCVGLLHRTPWTPTQDRAAFCAANLAYALGRGDEAAKLLLRLAGERRANEWVYRARLKLGFWLAAAGERGAAARWLAAIPQSGGGYHLMAQQQLEAMGRR